MNSFFIYLILTGVWIINYEAKQNTMYSTSFTLSFSQFIPANNTVFAPFLRCYQIQHATLLFNGLVQVEPENFTLGERHINLPTDYAFMETDHLVLNLTYFYKSALEDVFDFIIDGTFANPASSNRIASSHYIEAQFSLDNGLYKNAALNFGTTLEALLNRTLNNARLVDLINSHPDVALRPDMHYIRMLRNRVHPEQINLVQEVTRLEAIECRNKIEKILKNI